ncbi:MAG: DNA alkylation repair protein [bacterium]
MKQNMLTLSDLKKELKAKANSEKAKILQRFFKTGPGEYGEGDRFLGIMVPEIRKLAKNYSHLSLSDLQRLLASPFNEERLCALLILMLQFQCGSEETKKKIYSFYLSRTKRVNSWGLVDVSADKIVGAYLFDKPKAILYDLAKSENIWERRIAVMATFHFIKNNQFEETLKIAKMLLKDKHDLIHKAVGWMLREVGKRDLQTEEKFLKKHYKAMPRTMLRYAIEKFPEKKRKQYLLAR